MRPGTHLAPPGRMPRPSKSPRSPSLVTIERKILLVHGHRVLPDSDLAALYDVETRAIVQAVKRNPRRFPPDFMFRLEGEEAARLRSQTVISNKRGGRRYAPYMFTEQGVAMLSSVLKSTRAIDVNVQIMRAFVRMREMLATQSDVLRKINALEQKCDDQFIVVFDAIRGLMSSHAKPRRQIGFGR